MVSHQWLRQLKRRGIKTISAIQFKIEDPVEVKVGRFNAEHVSRPAAEAVKAFIEHDTGLGLEIVVPFSIPAKAITRVYTPNQVLGWQYYPEAHADNRRPCGCPFCQRGQIKSRALRRRYEEGL